VARDVENQLAASAESPSDMRTVAGKSFLRMNWQALSTKQRPSSATCCIVANQVSRSSAVGAQWIATFLA
jgi:hypothetical protein